MTNFPIPDIPSEILTFLKIFKIIEIELTLVDYKQAFNMIRAGSCTSDVVACLENNKLDKSFIIKSILAQFLVINKCSVTQDECYC